MSNAPVRNAQTASGAAGQSQPVRKSYWVRRRITQAEVGSVAYVFAPGYSIAAHELVLVTAGHKRYDGALHDERQGRNLPNYK